jgi:hypothetical protein
MKIKYAKGTDPRALIVVPARELALQVHESIKMLAKYTDLRSVALVGGVGTKITEGCAGSRSRYRSCNARKTDGYVPPRISET